MGFIDVRVVSNILPLLNGLRLLVRKALGWEPVCGACGQDTTQAVAEFMFLSPSEGRQNENHRHRKLTNLITWTTALSNSAMPCRVTQDGWVMMESSDKTWSTGEGNGKPLKYSCLENHMNSMKRQKDRTLRDKLPRSVGAQYATGDQWRNSSRKNEEAETK